jgi:lipoprotein-anchoring transpeptidase ErfK/SrfK
MNEYITAFGVNAGRWLSGLACMTLAGTMSLGAELAAPEGNAGGKRVEIDKTRQMLRAYEGGRLVMESRVSTGRQGRRTPDGRFVVGDKFRMHHSRLYHNAPMPYSVQVSGNYFIHGFTSVPRHPSSHGCVRLPLDGDNPAKRFFEWVEPGTPVEITGEWKGK